MTENSSTDIRHISGQDNSVADALSRINTISLDLSLKFMAELQEDDSELIELLQNSSSSSLVLKKLPLESDSSIELFCDVSTKKIRPFVPQIMRRKIFDNLHGLSHPGVKATVQLLKQRFCWPSIQADLTKWTRCCI